MSTYKSIEHASHWCGIDRSPTWTPSFVGSPLFILPRILLKSHIYGGKFQLLFYFYFCTEVKHFFLLKQNLELLGGLL